jgi:uncharacterized membrane protein YwzB
MHRNAILFPSLLFARYDLYIENGHAAPKQSSMIISKILIDYSIFENYRLDENNYSFESPFESLRVTINLSMYYASINRDLL